MAKSDSFFIRASTDFNGQTFNQSSIDLGAYVDALGKSVLRIHNVSVMWGDGTQVASGPDTSDAINKFQLTTQSQTAIVNATDKSLIASGALQAGADATGVNQTISQAIDIGPQHWRNGYLVGVEQIYMGVDSSSGLALGLTSCSIVLECTVETLSQAGAMALALSQQ
jgi:hypothetical protein